MGDVEYIIKTAMWRKDGFRMKSANRSARMSEEEVDRTGRVEASQPSLGGLGGSARLCYSWQRCIP